VSLREWNKRRIVGRPGASFPSFQENDGRCACQVREHITYVGVASYAIYPMVCDVVMIAQLNLCVNTGRGRLPPSSNSMVTRVNFIGYSHNLVL